MVCASFMGTCIVAAKFYSLFTRFNAIPSNIPWVIWTASVLRSAVLLAGYICCLDLYQTGSMVPALMVDFAVLVCVGMFVISVWEGDSLNGTSSSMAAMLLLSLIGFCARLALVIKREQARVPAIASSRGESDHG